MIKRVKRKTGALETIIEEKHLLDQSTDCESNLNSISPRSIIRKLNKQNTEILETEEDMEMKEILSNHQS